MGKQIQWQSTKFISQEKDNENTHKSRCHQHKRGREFIELQPSSDLKSGLLQAPTMRLSLGDSAGWKEKWTWVNIPWISTLLTLCQALCQMLHCPLTNAETMRNVQHTGSQMKTATIIFAVAESSRQPQLPSWGARVCAKLHVYCLNVQSLSVRCMLFHSHFADKEAEAQRGWETCLSSHSRWQNQDSDTALALGPCSYHSSSVSSKPVTCDSLSPSAHTWWVCLSKT